jgi:hypothetical protein
MFIVKWTTSCERNTKASAVGLIVAQLQIRYRSLLTLEASPSDWLLFVLTGHGPLINAVGPRWEDGL